MLRDKVVLRYTLDVKGTLTSDLRFFQFVCVFKASVDDSLTGLAHQIKGSADHWTVTDVTINLDANNNDRFNALISANVCEEL